MSNQLESSNRRRISAFKLPIADRPLQTVESPFARAVFVQINRSSELALATFVAEHVAFQASQAG